MSTEDLDFLVGGRRNSTKRLTLGQQKQQLWRTVKKSPEVMVKVSGGGKTTQHVRAHMDYITRNGKLPAVTDQGEEVTGRESVHELHGSWDIDLQRGQGKLKQAFNIVLSMPEGTDPTKVLEAAKALAREEFGAKRQYLMVLHEPDTDPHKKKAKHPHVHLLVKAEDFDGKRLHIRKADLERWRGSFAEKLRDRGVEANATPREIRGQTTKAKKGAIVALEERGKSKVLAAKVEEARVELLGAPQPDRPWEPKIQAKREKTIGALLAVSDQMKRSGDVELADALVKFARNLPSLDTERHTIKRALVAEVDRMRQEQGRGPDQQPAGKDHPGRGATGDGKER